jgi:hypothetical protein
MYKVARLKKSSMCVIEFQKDKIGRMWGCRTFEERTTGIHLEFTKGVSSGN